MRAKTDIGLTEYGVVTLITDPECRTQLVGAGGDIPDEQAEALGVLGDPFWDADAVDSVEEKAIEGPPEDKAMRPKSTKKKDG